MKKAKKSLVLALLSACAIGIAACGSEDTTNTGGGTGTGGDTGGGSNKCEHEWGEYILTTAPTEKDDGEETSTCSKCNKTKGRTVSKLGFEYNLTWKDANGNVTKTEKVRSINNISKPEDPTAPAGKKFYGWMNTENGGQIWDFDDPLLGKPGADIVLVPYFIPDNLDPQYLEAEFCPAITENGGMNGATYSGGQKGKGLIRGDEEHEYGSTCQQGEFRYFEDIANNRTLTYTGAEKWICNYCGWIGEDENAPAVCPNASNEEIHKLNANGEPKAYEIKAIDENKVGSYDPLQDDCGYFVHFHYGYGNTFTFNITSDKTVNDAIIFGRFSAEYGPTNETTGDVYLEFTDSMFPIAVNGVNIQYGKIIMHYIPGGQFLKFQDFRLSEGITLNEGNNVITMKIDNQVPLFSTIKQTAPIIDCLKIYTSANIAWPEAKFANIISD